MILNLLTYFIQNHVLIPMTKIIGDCLLNSFSDKQPIELHITGPLQEESNLWSLYSPKKASNIVLILGLHPANERRHYKVTPSLIGWGQT